MENQVWKRHAIEDLWRERQQVALRLYREARARAAEIHLQHAEILTPAPDGLFAFTEALKVEDAALREYCRVLTIFNDLVIHRKMPPDEPPLQW